jgi:hypothetical protein
VAIFKFTIIKEKKRKREKEKKRKREKEKKRKIS